MSTARPKLGEVEAWRYIAEQFLRAAAGERGDDLDTAQDGFCNALDSLWGCGMIDDVLEKQMRREVKDLMTDLGRSVYLLYGDDGADVSTDWDQGKHILRGTLALIFAEARNANS